MKEYIERKKFLTDANNGVYITISNNTEGKQSIKLQVGNQSITFDNDPDRRIKYIEQIRSVINLIEQAIAEDMSIPKLKDIS